MDSSHAFERKPLVLRQTAGLLVTGLTVLAAVSLGAAPATAAPTSPQAGTTSAKNTRCPDELWQGGDVNCRISFTGSNWYSGDWVALHTKGSGDIWANGYTPKNVEYEVGVVNEFGAIWSPWKRGGTGVGQAVGDLWTNGFGTGILKYASGTTLYVS
ncbi:hypothetical protein [Streptomyces goshikiensis]|uniref:hypothetical protein n=1 Tax=Streptomyces goshikiensis TaxID=1942 RepID=UPI0036601B5B